MRLFRRYWLFAAAAILALLAGLVGSEAGKTEGPKAARTRLCEERNVTEVQTHECMLRLAIEGRPDQRFGLR
jgi:hypothetical protein